MTSKHKEIARREFLTMSTKNAAGIFALTTLASCTTSEELTTDENPIIGDNENRQIVTSYELDPDWPQKPEEITWGAVPGVVVDMHDRVWMLNRSLPVVQVYDADGKFLTAWGKMGVEADSTSNEPVDLTFSNPGGVHQLKVDHEGNVWIAAWRLYVVYKCTPEGKLLLTLGTLNEPGDDETHFNMPQDMAITPTGEVFVADGEYNGRIVHFDSKGRFIKAWGREGTGPGEFVCPHAIAIDSKGLIYVADRGNTRVQVFDQSGKFLDQWPDIIVPFDLKISSEGDIWVCGFGPLRSKTSSRLPMSDEQLVLKFNPQGKLLLLWALPKGHNPGELDEVHGIALDSRGNIYLGDARGNRIQKFVRQ